MESVGALGGPNGASSNLLSLPAPCLWDEDEESLGLEGIKPKSSPIPRRRSSVSSDDDSQPPPSSSRRVSFADAFGLSLVSVKQFDAWPVTVPPDPLESDLSEDKEYYMVPLFALPQKGEELDLRVHEQKIELENLELLPGTTTLRGIVRVLNLCFDKMVYVRTSLDLWKSHFDLLAEYVPGSNNGEMDCFFFRLTLVPPFGEEGTRVDFCLRFETSLGTFWANNNEQNYTLFCYEKTKEKPQNERENRRKSCLKGTSSNSCALTAATTNNEEFPDIILQATGPEFQNTSSEELQKESKELLEEMGRNRSQRNKRKAARLAKVKEHFAQREEEKKQGTKTKEGEITEETSMQENASVLGKEPCGLSQQTTSGPPTRNQISPSPTESLRTAELSEDSTDMFKQQALEQHVQDTMIHFETNQSRARPNSSQEDTDDLSDQTVSISQPAPGCQSSDLSTCKDIERAWKYFEQDAKQRIKSLAQSPKMDEDVNTSKGKPAHRESVSLKTSNSVPQLFSHSYAFGTIVAPLYHQVFKNMETERKDFIQRAFQVDRTLRELQDDSLSSVRTPESDQPPMRQTTEVGPEPCVSTKETECDITAGESTVQNSENTVNPTKYPLSEPNRGKHVQEAVASHNYQRDYTSDIKKTSTDIKFNEVSQNLQDPTNTQSQTKVENITLHTQTSTDIDTNLPLNVSNQFPEESQILCNINFEVPQNDLNPSPTQTQQQITSILRQNPAETLRQDLVSGRSIETANLSTTSSVKTEYSICTSYILTESPEMLQTSGITLDCSDDKLEPDCSEMRLTNEKLYFSLEAAKLTEPYKESESTQINISTASESCQINEKKEQMIVAFSTQTSRPERSSIIDGTNDCDGEHGNTPMIKETEEPKNIQKGELDEQDICHISEGLVEKEKGNQVMQMEKQKVEDQELQEKQEGTEEEQEVKGQGINNIEDELKYIDDDDDINMGAVEIQKKQNQQTDTDTVNQSLEREPEEEELVIITTNAESLPQNDIKLDDPENQQSKDGSCGGDENTEKEERDTSNGATGEETGSSWQEAKQKNGTVLSGSLQAKRNDWDHLEFIDNKDNVCCESEKLQNERKPDDENNMQENMECQSNDYINRDIEKDVEDNTSTESLIDDEMELYLTCLRNSQQSVFREGVTNGSYSKRPSMSKGRPLAMPSISETVDEEQPNSNPEDATNIEDITELESATLLLVEENEHAIGRNVLWWKKFLSYDNMSRIFGYTFLLILFFIVAYYYDFVACLALYLLTVYWLFHQGEGEKEPMKSSRRGKKELQ